MTPPVYIAQIAVTEAVLEDIVGTINRDIYVEDGDVLVTVEEVKAKPKMLKYLCQRAAEGGLYDIEEVWNSDGFCDFADYR